MVSFKVILVMYHFSWCFAVFLNGICGEICSIFFMNVKKKDPVFFCACSTFCCFFLFLARRGFIVVIIK